MMSSEPTAAQKPQLSTGKKILQGIKNGLTLLVMLAAVAMMIFTVISVRTFDQNDRDLLGYKAFIVRTDSMRATDFSAGDLVLIKEVDPATLAEGDIIAFRSTAAESFGETFTHKIRTRTVDADGNPAFVTYGTTTGVDDTALVLYDDVLGKYQFALPGIGSFFLFLRTVPGYICCILLPFLLLIVLQGINSIRLFRKYRAEELAVLEEKRQKELAEMTAERARLEAERAESQRMLEELRRIQAELQSEKNNPQASDSDQIG